MRIPNNASMTSSMRFFVQVASLITMLIGSLVLLGWALDIVVFKSILPQLTSMKANTAIGFMITGLALWFLLKRPATQLARAIVLVCAVAIALLGLLTLIEYVFGWQFGIDQLFFKDSLVDAVALFPGRMSFVAALNFFFMGIAIFFLERKTPFADQLAHFLAFLILLFSGLALLGYAYGASSISGIGVYNQIAVHAAVTFIIAATGLLGIYPDRGLMPIITSENAGSFMARRLLLTAILLPMILGWLYLQGQRAGFYDTELGVALIVSSILVAFIGIIGLSALLLNQKDVELKLAQAADLRLNEERLRHVIWAIRDAIWDRNMVNGEIWWNESLRKLFQYRDEDIRPSVSWWEEHIHPDDREKVVHSINIMIERGENFWSKEYRFQRADGSYANIFDRGYILFNQQTGQPQRMIGAMADITEQKQIEQTLRQSQELFSKAFSASPAGIMLTRKSDALVIEVNDAYMEITGYSRNEFLNHTTLELGVISVQDRTWLLQTFQKQGTIRDFEHWVRTKSGSLKAMLSSFEQVTVGDVTCFLSISYDITERKQAEIAQQQSEALFRALFELSPDSVLIIDPYDPNVSWPIIDCNAAACSMNGYERSELIGHSIDILNGSSGTPAEREVYIKLLREQGSIKAEFRHRHKNGVFFPVETSTTFIRIGERELIIGIDRDITERKQAEDALHQTNDHLKRGLAELDRRNYEIMILNELGNLLQTCQTSDEAYAVISSLVPKIFPETAGALYISGAPENNIVEAAATWKTISLDELIFMPDDCFALRRGRPYFVSEDHPGLHCRHLVGNTPISYICVPMMSQGESLGMFHLQHLETEAPKNSSFLDLGLVETVADTIALALTNLMLRETLRSQSTRDSLTGLFNRRFMEESLDREIHQATHNHRSLGIIMLDIDHFKSLNDTFGHEAGDTVLHELGNFLKYYIRKGDIACRYGGEEFLLLLPEASLENTRQRALELCEEVQSVQVYHQEKLMLRNITVSIGVAVFPAHGESRDEIVRAADKALYQAKKKGRNRVVGADEL
jgi:diguanylate cyclase (GGDEF)-like protein/PAS domain S-box-containing protein